MKIAHCKDKTIDYFPWKLIKYIIYSILDDEYEEIEISIYEKKKQVTNKTSNILGQVVICAKNYPSAKVTDLWFEVQPPPLCDTKYVVTGKMHVILQHSRNPNVNIFYEMKITLYYRFFNINELEYDAK